MLTILFLCLAMVAGPLGVTTRAVQASNIIEGRVTNKSGKGISDARVSLSNESYSQVGSTLTDGSGRYSFKGLPSGVYYVEVEPSTENLERTPRQRIEARAFNERQVPANSGLRGGGEVFRLDIVVGSSKPTGATSDRVSSLILYHQDVPETAKVAFEQGRKSLEKDDYNGAVKSLKQAVALFADYYDALELLGTEYVKRNNFAEAIPLLQHAVEMNKDSWRGFYSLGIAQYSTNNRAEGIRSLQRAAELNPDSPNAQMRLGMMLAVDPQMRTGAIQALEKATKLSKEPIPMAYLYLGGLYAKNEQYREAAESFKTLLKIEPNIGERDKIQQLIAQYQQKAKEQNKK